MRYPSHLLKLIEMLKRLPGVGNKSAERFAFQLLNWRDDRLQELGETINLIPQKLGYCEECGCLIGEEECQLCQDLRKQAKVICVIASPKDAFAIEETREYKGLYHVLGGLLSPLEGRGADSLRIQSLKKRIAAYQVSELVIALDSTLEGDATALYLKNELASASLKISRLAFGLPMGSSIDYVDGGTLARAFSGRSLF